jgi:hypothetical protein
VIEIMMDFLEEFDRIDRNLIPVVVEEKILEEKYSLLH